MNPILLKPNSDSGSQVVVNGKVWKTLPAREYYAEFPFLLGQVLDAYERLSARYDFIVLEGAGSITELNLKRTDLVNLGLATRLHVPVLLVADIDRGGVFAAVTGTFGLLDESEHALVRGFAINRFRGDPKLFESGVELLETRTCKPCLGVFPYLRNAPLDPEDGVTLEDGENKNADIAIVALPHVSNLSDFRLLENARRVSRPVEGKFTCVILPGTKNTIGDLAWLRKNRLDEWIMVQHRGGATVIGICGGYQIMGERVDDPLAVESNAGGADGLGLLPVRTVMGSGKVTRPVKAVTPSGIEFDAYEIHHGVTSRPNDALPFATLAGGAQDGVRSGRCAGTYLHGALEDTRVLGELLGRSVAPIRSREQTYEALADWFEANVNHSRFQELYLCG